MSAQTCLTSCEAQPPWSPDTDQFAQLFNESPTQSLMNEADLVLFGFNGLNEEKNVGNDLCLDNIDLESLLADIQPTGLSPEFNSESSNTAIESLDDESSAYLTSSSSESEPAKKTSKKRKCPDSATARVGRGGKVDKKESNKAAAVRYRCKKALEKDRLFAECELYDKKNAEMRVKISDLESEIDFIKSLLVQAFLAKNSNASSMLSMMSTIV